MPVAAPNKPGELLPWAAEGRGHVVEQCAGQQDRPACGAAVGGWSYRLRMTTSGTAPSSDTRPDTVRGSSFDPVLMLASALQAVPGSHAVVLGAGVSIAAGVPSAWGVQEELIRRIAAARGDEVPGAPHDWYRDAYSAEATYEGLLQELAPTQHERQAILRTFFEPDPRDGDAVPHEPSQAHVALARLAKSGHLRVFVTLNFDHLMERALRAAGIEPTVVHSLAGLEGLAPLHTIPCLVVHLHGDYLTATAMRNTTSELAEYEPVVVDFLQRMLHDHALLIVGWSAQYDPALREQISRGLLERYSSYWVTPSPLGSTASELAISRRIVHVAATADVALARLADAIDALEARRAGHPLTLADAVGAVKREIGGRPVAIGVHDRLRTALAEIWDLPDLNRTDFQRMTEPFDQLDARLTEAAMTSAALIGATSYWGDERTDAWWIPDVVRFSTTFRGGGITRLLELPHVVGTVLFHAAGVAAVAAGRFRTARGLLTARSASGDGSGGRLPERLHATAGNARVPSVTLMKTLQPIFIDDLSLGEHSFEEAWELFDLLVLVEGVTSNESFERLSLEHRVARMKRTDLEKTEGSAETGGGDRAALRTATEAEEQSLDDIAALIWPVGHHIRAGRTDFHTSRSTRAEAILQEIDRARNNHPLVEAGFGLTDWEKLHRALAATSVAVGRIGQNVTRQRIAPQGSGMVPDYLWLDTGDTPRL
jgi:hypothetical protein